MPKLKPTKKTPGKAAPKAHIKAAADRAEKRSKGEALEEPKVAIDPIIARSGIKEDPAEAEKRGRPTEYDPSFDSRAAELCEGGAKDEELADEFGVSTRTINRWKIAHPTFRQSVKDAKKTADERVKRSLYHKALGLEYEEMQPIKLKKIKYSDGKKVSEEEYIELVPVKKFVPPDTTAGIFWMKNRDSQNWRDVQKHEHGQPGDFDRMTDEELDEYIRAEASQALAEVSGSGKGKTRH